MRFPALFNAVFILLFAGHAVPSPIRDQPLRSEFTLRPPASLKRIRTKTLWATWYWTPSYSSSGRLAPAIPGITSGKARQDALVPLLDIHERPLGPKLPAEEFCHAAVQGAVRIDGVVYTFDDVGKVKLTNCERFRPDMPQAPYVRFRRSATAFGEGDNDYALVPYRSVAVDPKAIPIGTVLYIPEARGNRLTLPDGTRALHDGYFFAADNGYGVEKNHIDVFNGINSANPFPWVRSKSDRTFTAYIITDAAIKRRLERAHRRF